VIIHITKHHYRENLAPLTLVSMTPKIARYRPSLALAALLGCGCAHPTTGSMAMAHPRDDNERNVTKLFNTFNDDDLAPIDDLVAPGYLGPQGEKGPAGFRATILGLRTAFPDIQYTIDEMVAAEDGVAVRWHWTGTHRGRFRGLPPSGRQVVNAGLGIFRLRDGKIAAGTIETDRLGFLQQIGALPENLGLAPRRPPAEPGAPQVGGR
jgi:steroid delta-isomerase-like uncharacterized protein